MPNFISLQKMVFCAYAFYSRHRQLLAFYPLMDFLIFFHIEKDSKFLFQERKHTVIAICNNSQIFSNDQLMMIRRRAPEKYAKLLQNIYRGTHFQGLICNLDIQNIYFRTRCVGRNVMKCSQNKGLGLWWGFCFSNYKDGFVCRCINSSNITSRLKQLKVLCYIQREKI